MRIVQEKNAVSGEAERAREDGLSIEFVPTMGYLHEGHVSLIDAARSRGGFVVLSIFVNPTQFGRGEDLDRYPRDMERDAKLAREAGVDLIFHPSIGEMYAADHCTWVDVEGLSEHLCGAGRPGHFRGVATVVAKLFNIVGPDRAYIGQKDGQQALVIARMVRDLDLPVEIVVCPIVREEDGLAVSSRNTYLSEAERAQAPVLYAGLQEAAALFDQDERDGRRLVMAVTEKIGDSVLAQIEYAELVRTSDVRPAGVVDQEVMLAVAVRFGGTRLIDNLVLDPSGPSVRGLERGSTSSPTC